MTVKTLTNKDIPRRVTMCKKVREDSLLPSEGQEHKEKKAVRTVNTPIPYVCEKVILQSSHKCQSASASDGYDSWHAMAATESILSTFCFNSRWIN